MNNFMKDFEFISKFEVSDLNLTPYIVKVDPTYYSYILRGENYLFIKFKIPKFMNDIKEYQKEIFDKDEIIANISVTNCKPGTDNFSCGLILCTQNAKMRFKIKKTEKVMEYEHVYFSISGEIEIISDVSCDFKQIELYNINNDKQETD